MAIAKVGSAVTFSSGTSTVSSSTGQTLSITPTAGDALVLWAVSRSSTGGNSITVAAVGGSASFTQEVDQIAGTSVATIFCFVAVNVGSGITGVKVTPNASVAMDMWICEYSGVDSTTPMDVTPVSGVTGSSTTAQSSSSISPITSGALVLAGVCSSGNSGTTTPFKATTAGPTTHTGTNAGTGWTSEHDLWNQGGNTTSLDFALASDGCNTTSGAYQCDWTLATSANAGLGAVTLRPAAVAAAGGGPTSVIISNPFVGPMALRQRFRQPRPWWASQGNTDGANTTITWSASDDGFVDHPGAKTSVVIPNPFVGPQALRNQKRMPYYGQQRQGYTDGANSTWTVGTSDDGFVDHPGAKTAVTIPNPFVGPMALRQQKRMPYYGSRSQAQNQTLSDGANTTWTFTTSGDGVRGTSATANSTWTFTTTDDGFVDHPGARTSVIIPTPFVGPMALRNQKRMPYRGYVSIGNADGANSTWAFSTSDDGFVDHKGARTSVIIPNPFVGPMVLRGLKRMPYYTYRATGNTDSANSTWTFTASDDGHRGISEGANTTIVFTTSDDGFIDHPGAKTAVVIPNQFVGPTALRNRKRLPYRVIPTPPTFQTLSDGANTVWTFTTSTDGRLAIKDGANTTIVWVTSDDGFVDHKGAKTSVVIPNQFVGPQALRHLKHMPYYTYRVQGNTDSANSTWNFSTSDDGHRGMSATANSTWTFGFTTSGIRGVRGGANLLVTFSESDQGHVNRHDSANISIVFGHSIDGHVGRHDGATLTIAFTTSDDGFPTSAVIDPRAIVIVGPNETRSVTITPQALTQILQLAGFTTVVTNEQRTIVIPVGGAVQIVQ